MGLKAVVHLGNTLSPWRFLLLPLCGEGEEPEEGAEVIILLLYGEAEAAWIPRALKNEAHLLRGEAESSEFILVHFIPESPFSGAPSYRNCTNAQLVLWEGNTQTLEDKNHSQEEQRKPRGAKLLSQDHTEAEWMGRNTGAWLTSFKPIMFTIGLCPSYGSHNDDAHSLSGFGASRTCK